jgi:adenine-specific DNA-methyltransferase
MVAYIGSKEKIRTFIFSSLQKVSGDLSNLSFLDIMCGSCAISKEAHNANMIIHGNDISPYPYGLFNSMFCAGEEVSYRALDALNRFDYERKYGYLSENFGERNFTLENTMVADNFRNYIEKIEDESVKNVLRAALVLGLDRVRNDTGTQKSYLKTFGERAKRPIYFELPEYHFSPLHSSSNLDAWKCAKDISSDFDITYIDPPYNGECYFSCYHIFQTIFLGDSPETYGIGNKRIDSLENKSFFSRKKTFAFELERLIENCNSKVIAISFSNEGFLGNSPSKKIISILQKSKKGKVFVFSEEHARNTMSANSIMNGGHRRNLESLIIFKRG